MDALTLEGVTHAYGPVRAVDGADLSVAEHELVCLLGPSGCGKTTVLRLAAGLEELQQGRILINGRTVAGRGVHVPPEDRGVGLVFQDYALFPHLTVTDNVAFGLLGLPASERRSRALEALALVGMSDYAATYPHALSGGQQQRVALARALAPRPRIMLLDEPFSGLDLRLRNQVRDETLHVLKRSGCSTLLVTHDAEEAMFMADRIAIMRHGRLVQMGRPADLYYEPADAFVAGFFGEVNILPGIARGGVVPTPLGTLEARRIPDGTAVDVLVRPEALHIVPGMVAAGEGSPARVMAARLLGASSLIHLSLDGEERSIHLHARVPGRFLLPEDEWVTVTLDKSQAFVFAAGART